MTDPGFPRREEWGANLKGGVLICMKLKRMGLGWALGSANGTIKCAHNQEHGARTTPRNVCHYITTSQTLIAAMSTERDNLVSFKRNVSYFRVRYYHTEAPHLYRCRCALNLKQWQLKPACTALYKMHYY